MKTKEKFFQRLINAFANRQAGFTAAECSALFAVKRNVISHYLNRLHDDGLLTKDNHRPVRFLFANPAGTVSLTDCFSTLTGATQSLQQQITLCRAAMDYPPDGLALLLTGESGTGKSHLASLIHYYAQQRGFIPADRPQVELNCADYANNPELLSSILFGYCKGAFTGADREKHGLLDQANQGTLFLDEVHRLSAENQEKLFLFMDKGYFYRLGDNKHPNASKIRFIFATTENTDTVLLNTFRRRIPVIVSLPAYHQRTHSERIALIELFLKQEAQLLQRDIHIDNVLFSIWLNTKLNGNIGELKNKIKVLCATRWSSQRDNLPLLLADQASAQTTEKNYWLIQHDQPYTSTITRSPLLMAGDIQQAIQQFCITTDASQYLRTLASQFSAQHPDGNHLLFQGTLWQMIQAETKQLSEYWGMTLPEDILQAFYLSFCHTLYCKPDNEHIRSMNRIRHQTTTKAFLLASELINAIALSKELKAPELLLSLTSLLLAPLTDQQECIQGIIVTHGKSTASSIASLANQLTGGYYLTAFNMPYPASTRSITNLLIQHLNLLHSDAGMIILVDMGSLKEIYHAIHQHLRGDLVVVNNVTTILALDIAEKIQQHYSIDEIIEQIPGSYETEVRYYSGISSRKQIIISCISGGGIAKKLQDIIHNAFYQTSIEVITLDYDILKKQLQQKNALLNTILIITTTEIDTGDIPSFSISYIISNNQNLQLQQCFSEWLTDTQYIEMVRDIITLFTIEGISKRLEFLNPDIIINEIKEIISQYEKYYKCQFENYLHINMLMHIALMIERLMLNNGYQHRDHELLDHQQQAFINLQYQFFQPLIDKYRISLSVTEMLMMYEILSGVIGSDTNRS